MDNKITPNSVISTITSGIWLMIITALSVGAMAWAVRFMYTQLKLTWG